MELKEFEKFLENQLAIAKNVLSAKSADYAAGGDKLANFKLQARIDGITPIEALRGNWLKHRTSIVQGLDELLDPSKALRKLEWWEEKLTDDRNYNLLLHALIYETYFKEKQAVLTENGFIIAESLNNGWYVCSDSTYYLHKDLTVQKDTGYGEGPRNYGEAPGYYKSEAEARRHLQNYLNVQNAEDGDVVRVL